MKADVAGVRYTWRLMVIKQGISTAGDGGSRSVRRESLRSTVSRWIVGLAVCLSVLGTPPVAAQEPAVEAGQADVRRIVSYFTIGGSAISPAARNVGWNIRREGWSGFVGRYVVPQLRAGIRRFQLHNPFGTLADEPMQFDQYMHARDTGLRWLYDDFVEAWQPVIDGAYTDGEPVEVIAYLGKLPNDPDFDELLREDHVDFWLGRAILSMNLPLKAGMSIGFDAVAEAGEGSPAHRLTQLLESLGVRVYIEARPYAQHSHWFDNNLIIIDSFWHRSNPQRHPDSAWAAANDRFTGEIVRMITRQPPPGQNWNGDWIIGQVHGILRDGHTASIPYWPMQRDHVTLRALLAFDRSDARHQESTTAAESPDR